LGDGELESRHFQELRLYTVQKLAMRHMTYSKKRPLRRFERISEILNACERPVAIAAPNGTLVVLGKRDGLSESGGSSGKHEQLWTGSQTQKKNPFFVASLSVDHDVALLTDRITPRHKWDRRSALTVIVASVVVQDVCGEHLVKSLRFVRDLK
jgi:hypothetical protein